MFLSSPQISLLMLLATINAFGIRVIVAQKVLESEDGKVADGPPAKKPVQAEEAIGSTRHKREEEPDERDKPSKKEEINIEKKPAKVLSSVEGGKGGFVSLRSLLQVKKHLVASQEKNDFGYHLVNLICGIRGAINRLMCAKGQKGIWRRGNPADGMAEEKHWTEREGRYRGERRGESSKADKGQH